MDSRLLDKYGGRGPRYTSHPTADRFVEAFDEEAYRHWLGHRRVGGTGLPFGLYGHVPFCDVSSIGKVGSAYSQNVKELDADYAALDAGHLPVLRGIEPGWIHVTGKERSLVRAVCMVFDRYLRAAGERVRYSRVM